MILDLKKLAFPITIAMFVFFAPAGLDLLYRPNVTGDDRLFWPSLWGISRQLFCVFVAGLVLVSKSRGVPFRTLLPLWPVLLLSLLSTVWSSDSKNTLRQMDYIIGVAIGMSAVVRWVGIPAMVRMSAIITGSFMIASVLVAVLPPHMGMHLSTDVREVSLAGDWRGIFNQKNVLGEISVTASLLLSRSLKNETRYWKVFFWVARFSTLICVIFAKSANSVAAFFLCSLLLAALSYRPTAHPKVVSLFAALVVVAVAGFSITPAHVAGMLGKDPTFTGRTEIWKFAEDRIMESPWFGHGYDTADARMVGEATKALFDSATNLHSAYLDTIYNIGIVGLVLLLGGCLFILGRAYIYSFEMEGELRRSVLIYMCIVVSALSVGLGETSPLRVVGDGVVGFWISMIALCQVQRPSRKTMTAAGHTSGRASLKPVSAVTPGRQAA